MSGERRAASPKKESGADISQLHLWNVAILPFESIFPGRRNSSTILARIPECQSFKELERCRALGETFEKARLLLV